MDFQFPALVVSSCGVLIVKQAIVMNSVASVMNFHVRRTYDERRHCYGKVAFVMKYSAACRKGYPEDAPEGGPEGLRSGWVGFSGAEVGEVRTFAVLYNTTPDQPPHGGVTGTTTN